MKTKFKIARTLWAGLFPLYIMEELNLIPDGFEIIDVEEYDETLLLLEQGKIDANFNSLADALLLISKGTDLKLIMPSDLTVGVDGLVSNKDYVEIAQLLGKKIGVSFFTYSHVLLNQIFKKYGFSENDFDLINMRGEYVPAMIKSGEISAGHTWGIHMQEAIQQGSKLLFTSEEFPGLLVDSLVVRKDALEGSLQKWREFINAHEFSVSFWQKNQDDAKKIICKRIGFSSEKIETMLDGVQFFTEQDNLTLFDINGKNPPNLFASGKIFNNFFMEKGILKSEIDLLTILNPIE